jgi:hypothetical protein
MLDITNCLYDAISRLEKAIEEGIALASAVEGVEGLVGISRLEKAIEEGVALASAVEGVEGLVGGNFSDICTFSSAIITFTFM